MVRESCGALIGPPSPARRRAGAPRSTTVSPAARPLSTSNPVADGAPELHGPPLDATAPDHVHHRQLARANERGRGHGQHLFGRHGNQHAPEHPRQDVRRVAQAHPHHDGSAGRDPTTARSRRPVPASRGCSASIRKRERVAEADVASRSSGTFAASHSRPCSYIVSSGLPGAAMSPTFASLSTTIPANGLRMTAYDRLTSASRAACCSRCRLASAVFRVVSGVLEIVGRNHLLVEQRLVACVVGLGLRERGLRAAHAVLRLFDPVPEVPVVEDHERGAAGDALPGRRAHLDDVRRRPGRSPRRSARPGPSPRPRCRRRSSAARPSRVARPAAESSATGCRAGRNDAPPKGAEDPEHEDDDGGDGEPHPPEGGRTPRGAARRPRRGAGSSTGGDRRTSAIQLVSGA